jgi:hypothetical protein
VLPCAVGDFAPADEGIVGVVRLVGDLEPTADLIVEPLQAGEPGGGGLVDPVVVGDDPGEGDSLGVVDHRDQRVELGGPVVAGVEEEGEATVAVVGPVVAFGPAVQDLLGVFVGFGDVVTLPVLVDEPGVLALGAYDLGDRCEVVLLVRVLRR